MIGRVVADVIVLMTSVIYLMTLFFISARRGDRSEEEVGEPVRPRRRQDLMCPSCLHQKADENRPSIHHGNPRAHRGLFTATTTACVCPGQGPLASPCE